MNLLSPVEDKRRVVPRWRDFRKTTFTGELSGYSAIALPSNVGDSPYLLEHLESWKEDQSIDIASEILFHCLTISRPGMAIEQATYLNGQAEFLTASLNNLVTEVLEGKKEIEIPLSSSGEDLSNLNKQIYSEIHRLKSILKEWPNNAIYWVEIARLYVTLGLQKKADRAIKNALQLAPTNRYVFRSAIRFYLHIGDPEYIFRLFSQYGALYHDPWVLASYVALQDVIKKKNFRIRQIRNLVLKLPEEHTTELAGALATLELNNGAIKSAKKLFNKSIVYPNDNSLAQVVWAESHVGAIADVSKIRLLFDHEARARDYFRNNEIRKSISSCIQWIIDEPFSSKPAIVGSYISSTFMADYDCAKQFCEIGLNANPTDEMLLNNYAVSLARTGNLSKAAYFLESIRDVDENTAMFVTILATKGLILFRSGSSSEGRKLYATSIDLAKKLNLQISQGVAAINLAEEELLVGEQDSEYIENILVRNLGKNLPKEIKDLANKIRRRLLTY